MPDENREHDKVPVEERLQPDPMLQMTTGHVGAASVTLAAFVGAVVLAIVFYGLNGGRTGDDGAMPPPAAHNAHPQSGGQGGPAAPGAPRADDSGVKG
jgi:hypothetical protein